MHRPIEDLILEHKDAVYRQMVRVCGDYDDAEDALAEAMLRAYQASESLRDEESFRAWLATIGRRVCGRMRRHASLAPVIALAGMDLAADPAPTPDEEAAMSETKSCIRSAIESLGHEYREVYVLREMEGISGEEVAERLGISLAAMKSRLHRARAMVRESLDRSVCAP